MSRPDILLFVSDQHTAMITGYAGDPIIDTPHLDRLAREGTAFDAAYTSCPLCVPARMSFLTGRYPSRTGVSSNTHVLDSDIPTFAHAMGRAGYETVLCGRMHFRGPDQHHGFERRLVGDFTPCLHLPGGQARKDLGPYAGTPAGDWDKLFGGGTSPVLEYDRAVVAAALDCLAEPRERPLLLVVGIYGPHHTFVAPPELYRKYLEIVPPPSREKGTCPLHPVLDEQVARHEIDTDTRHRVRAAYYGMIEHVDGLVGETRDTFEDVSKRRGRPHLFSYFSDHGEQGGERGLWGKSTFFEASARIPMVWAGQGVIPQRRLKTPVSMMEVGPTICALAGAEPPPEQDGQSFAGLLNGRENDPDRIVISEYIYGKIPARMVRWRKWKLVIYADGSDPVLYDIENDRGETRDLASHEPETTSRLREVATTDWSCKSILKERARKDRNARYLQQWGESVLPEDPYRWPVPESARQLPIA